MSIKTLIKSNQILKYRFWKSSCHVDCVEIFRYQEFVPTGGPTQAEIIKHFWTHGFRETTKNSVEQKNHGLEETTRLASRFFFISTFSVYLMSFLLMKILRYTYKYVMLSMLLQFQNTPMLWVERYENRSHLNFSEVSTRFGRRRTSEVWPWGFFLLIILPQIKPSRFSV